MLEPFKSITKDELGLTNKNNTPVAFKVKTTAPKQYCVRPNSGRIEPGEKVEVQIVLQPFKDEIGPDFKCRDKFLVQSIAISPEMESMPMTELWSMVEREAKSSINEKKLRVRYLPPIPSSQGGGEKQQQRQTTRTLPGPSPLAKSAIEDDESPPGSPVLPASPQKPKEDEKEDEKSNRLFPDTSLVESGEDTAQFVETNKGELEHAREAIVELERQVAEYKDKLQKQQVKQQPKKPTPTSVDGLSIQSVAIITLVAFLLGRFFF